MCDRELLDVGQEAKKGAAESRRVARCEPVCEGQGERARDSICDVVTPSLSNTRIGCVGLSRKRSQVLGSATAALGIVAWLRGFRPLQVPSPAPSTLGELRGVSRF